MFEFGKVVLIPFPFTDLTSAKLRPAVIMSTKQSLSDLILAFIGSSRTESGNQPGQFLYRLNDQDFAQTGLKVDSIFRFDKLATINKSLILGEIGEVSVEKLKQMQKSFEEVIGFYS